jgi:hypothetical protein
VVGEREGGARAGGSLLEHDDAADEGGPEGDAVTSQPPRAWRSLLLIAT